MPRYHQLGAEMDWRDFAYKTFWTAVSTFCGALVAGPVVNLDVTTLRAAGLAAATTIVNALTIYGRQQVS